MEKRLKKYSTSTDVEPVHHHAHKVTNPLHKATNKRELNNLEIEEKRKKQKKHNERSEEMQMEKYEKEIEKLKKSLKEMTETIKELRQIIQTSAVLPLPFRNREECNYGNKDHLGQNDHTLFCQGFDISVPRHEIKSALWKHFSLCGKVTRVYVPIECATGVALGFAFIDLAKHYKKGLKLNGSFLGGRKLCVMIGTARKELFGLDEDFAGCKRCPRYNPYRRNLTYHHEKYRQWISSLPMVGTRFSKIGRFTAIIGRLHGHGTVWIKLR
ncbi:PREDICTED: polyadenylate-binding protein 2-B-like [Camelina sativa]|uniref:Polyadenylate-binding protein 2-B-like n=1 Tax=Camelina sativa TaxID=90675 RepID=A0ABM0SU59_CAMSA|nr:PREDICTED: polyadenylate-binding protein 2-B-like [Camelina sativa]